MSKWSAVVGGMLAVAAGVGPATASIMIVSSDAASLKPGMELDDGAQIEIPAGAKVRILLPSGKTQLLSGPSTGKVADLVKGEPLAEGVWNKAKEFLATGGVDQSKQGATRSMTPGGNARFSWSVIAPTAAGDICIEQGASVVLSRASAAKASEADVVATSTSTRAKVAWAVGANDTPWPAQLPPKAGEVYDVVSLDAPRRQLRIHLLDKAATDDANALKAMVEKGCKDQLRLWVRQK